MAAPRENIDRWAWLGAAIVAIVALGIDLVQVANLGLWTDEQFSVHVAQESWTGFWHTVWGTEANMVLFYAVVHAWLQLVSLVGLPASAFVVHVPSAVFAALAVALVFALGQRFFGYIAGSIAATVYGLNYLQVFVADEARSYGLELLLLIASWYALLSALSITRRRGWWGFYVLGTSLAVYAHLFSVLIIAAQILAVIVAIRLSAIHERQAIEFAGASTLILLLISPIALDVARHGGPNVWVAPAGPADLIHLGGWLTGGIVPLAPILIALTLLGFVSTPRRWQTSALAAWALIPLVLSFVLTQSYLNLHLFQARYLVVIVPAIALLAGLGVSALRGSKLKIVAGIVVVALLVPALPKSERAMQQRASVPGGRQSIDNSNPRLGKSDVARGQGPIAKPASLTLISVGWQRDGE